MTTEQMKQWAMETPEEGFRREREMVSRIREKGVTFVLHLDIPDDEYVRAGEPGYVHTLTVWKPETASWLFQRLLTMVEKGEAFDIEDEAARGVSLFLTAGEDRQAFMAPLMEALTDAHLPAVKE